MNLTRQETETIINVNMEDKVGYIHTRIPKHHRHFERLGIQPTQVHKDSDGKEYAWSYEVPVGWVRMPRGRPKRIMSEEERKQVGERFRKARLAKKPL